MGLWNVSLPQNQRKTPDEMREHLLSNRILNGDCWEWALSCSRTGYGKVKWGKNRHLRVHRVAAHLWQGFDLNDTRSVCHHCDNPKCFNPQHLFVGTAKDNQQDCIAKGRHWQKNKTHCANGHEFTPENTWIDGTGARHCRTCHRENVLARYYMRREVEV